jgi:glycosyltransferase involved in cell wall biosynthesis
MLSPMLPPLLPEVELCAIVKDELNNPAGGIEDFVRTVVPFLGGAVIVDTGSSDGTREKLEALSSEFSQLRVYDYPLGEQGNYFYSRYSPKDLRKNIRQIGLRAKDRPALSLSAARNYSLSQATLPYVLVLDADERLPEPGFQKLRTVIDQYPSKECFCFDFRNYYKTSYLGMESQIIWHGYLHFRLFKSNLGILFDDGWPRWGEWYARKCPDGTVRHLDSIWKFLDIYYQKRELMIDHYKERHPRDFSKTKKC